MKSNSWSQSDLNYLTDTTISNKEMALRVGRSEAAVRGMRQRLAAKARYLAMPGPPGRPGQPGEPGPGGVLGPQGLKPGGVLGPQGLKPVEAPATYEEDKERTGSEYWKRQFRTLESKYERALKESSAVEQLVGLATELAPVAYAPCPYIPCDAIRGGSRPQSGLLMLSDTHVGQHIDPDQTLGYGGYNFPTFLARLKFLENATTSIVTDHTTSKMDELVVCLGGDMIHGALNHGAEAGQHSTLFQQFYGAGHALAQFLRNLSALAPKIRVYCTVGNHPRWSHQHKMPTENRYSNLDHFLYAYVEALTRDMPTVEWHLDRQPFALFDVQGFKFHLSHGDHLKGGDKALGIPNHAVGRMVSSTAQLFGKAQEASPHYFLVGHLHRSIVLPHARGSFIVNGGFPGLDGYGLAGGFSPVDPTQTFFLVHPKFGQTATYNIQLKHASVTDNPPYELPDNGFLPE